MRFRASRAEGEAGPLTRLTAFAARHPLPQGEREERVRHRTLPRGKPSVPDLVREIHDRLPVQLRAIPLAHHLKIRRALAVRLAALPAVLAE